MLLGIRPFQEQDLLSYQSWFSSDPELERRLSYPDDVWHEHFKQPCNNCWAVVNDISDLLAVVQVDADGTTGFIEMATRPDVRGRGVGTSALRAFIMGPGQNYEVLEARIAADNLPSLKLVRSCDFTLLPKPDGDGFVRSILHL